MEVQMSLKCVLNNFERIRELNDHMWIILFIIHEKHLCISGSTD